LLGIETNEESFVDKIIALLCIIKIGSGGLMGSVRSEKKYKRKKMDKLAENWEKELNIRYHDV